MGIIESIVWGHIDVVYIGLGLQICVTVLGFRNIIPNQPSEFIGDAYNYGLGTLWNTSMITELVAKKKMHAW